MFEPRVKKNIRMISGILAGVILVFYAAFLYVFKIVPTITSLVVTFFIIYVLYSVAVHWKKTPRKFGSTLLSIGIFLIILSLLFTSFNQRSDELKDALLIEGFYAGFERNVGLNISRTQLVEILEQCTPENSSSICLEYAKAKTELDTSFDKMVDTQMLGNNTPYIIEKLSGRYLKKQSINDVLDFDKYHQHNKDIGGLLLILGLIFFSLSWFAEKSYEKLAKSLSAVAFFSVASVFVTYKIIELVFLWIPDEIELVKSLLIEIVKLQSATLIWPMVITGVIWIAVNVAFIWYYYPKRNNNSGSGLR